MFFRFKRSRFFDLDTGAPGGEPKPDPTSNPDLLGGEPDPNQATPTGDPTTKPDPANPDLLGGDPDNPDATKKEGEPDKVVPEQYDLKLPEDLQAKGLQYNPDSVEAKEFTAVAKELGLTNEQAQKIMDLYAKRISQSYETADKEFSSVIQSWVGRVQADPEIGGNNWKANVVTAQRAIKQFATPEFRQLLSETGFANHPEFVRVFHRIGKALSEDSFPGNTHGGGKRTPEQILYSKSMPE